MESKNNWRVWLSAYAPVFLWLGFIFYLSSDSGSAEQTSRFIRPLLEFLFPNTEPGTIDLYHHYIRKAAHFTEYAILALLVARPFLMLRPAFRYWPVAALGIVSIIALADELNQSFRATRTASVYDSLIDISGGVFAILILCLFIKRRRIMRSGPLEQVPG